MDKVLFTPVGILAGLAAGFAGKVAFDQIWKLIDDEEPPEPEHREASMVEARPRARDPGRDLPSRPRHRRARRPARLPALERPMARRGAPGPEVVPQ